MHWRSLPHVTDNEQKDLLSSKRYRCENTCGPKATLLEHPGISPDYCKSPLDLYCQTPVSLGGWLELVFTNQSGADPACRTVGAVECIGIQVNTAGPGQGSRNRVNRDLSEYCVVVNCFEEPREKLGKIQLTHQPVSEGHCQATVTSVFNLADSRTCHSCRSSGVGRSAPRVQVWMPDASCPQAPRDESQATSGQASRRSEGAHHR